MKLDELKKRLIETKKSAEKMKSIYQQLTGQVSLLEEMIQEESMNEKAKKEDK
jgi:hypothetical protein